MNWNDHSRRIPKDSHAFLGASKYHWINYDEEKIRNAYTMDMAKKRGVELHALAEQLIRLKTKLPKSPKTLNMYVNDAISQNMTPEVLLYYSDNAFGTADAISYEKNFLRIFDLKTGITKASMLQLMIYMALFCLEYGIMPQELDGAELRIYQNDGIKIHQPEVSEIVPIMDKIVSFDRIISSLREV